MDPPHRHGDRAHPPPTPPSATPGSPPTSVEPGSATPVAVSAGSLPRHSSALSLGGGSRLNPFAAPFFPSSAAGTSRWATLEGLRFSDSDEDEEDTRRPKLDLADKVKGKEVAQSPSRRSPPPPQVARPAPSDFMAAARLPAPIRALRVGVPTQEAALTTKLLHILSEAEKSSYVSHINTPAGTEKSSYVSQINTPAGNQLFDHITDVVLLRKLINVAGPGTIDERAINKESVLSPLERNENHTLCLNSAKTIGCTVVNIGIQDLVEGRDIDEVLSLSPEKPKQSEPNWSDIHIDIMGKLMMEYLNSLEDRASMRAVCRNWRACVEECLLSSAYLLLPGGTMYQFPDFTPRYFNGCKGYSGSCQGYILFSESGGVDGPRHLLKYPFLGRGFAWLLPSLFAAICGSDGRTLLSQWWNGAKEMDVRKLVMCPNNTIAAILGSECSARVAIYWLSRHLWFVVDDQFRRYEDLAFCNGRLYALTGMEELLAFDIGNVNDGVGAAKLVIKDPAPAMRSTLAAHYLVRSRASNALLMVRRQLELYPSHENAQVSVFRADLASSQWVEVTDLGREALLVGRLGSGAMPVPAYDKDTSCNILKGNTILFATVDRVDLPSLQGVAIYDMRKGGVKLRRVITKKNWGPDSATWLFPHEDILR